MSSNLERRRIPSGLNELDFSFSINTRHLFDYTSLPGLCAGRALVSMGDTKPLP